MLANDDQEPQQRIPFWDRREASHCDVDFDHLVLSSVPRPLVLRTLNTRKLPLRRLTSRSPMTSSNAWSIVVVLRIWYSRNRDLIGIGRSSSLLTLELWVFRIYRLLPRN